MNAQQKQDAIVKVGEHARQTGLEFFHDRWREAYATVPVKGHTETWRIGSLEMRSWVERAFYEKFGCAPQPWVNLMLDEFRLRALYEGEQREVHVRTAEADGVLYIDMADEQWRAIQVTPTGWSVIEQPAVKFRRTL